MPLTKIICTLGPASRSPDTLIALARGGMNIVRLNLSHETIEDHRGHLRAAKELFEREGLGVATLLDTKGAEIRTGDVAEKVQIHRGQEVVFSSSKVTDSEHTVIRIDYPEFARDAAKAESILIDNGELRFALVEARPDGTVLARAEDDGLIGSRRHVNLPGADISLPSLTESDWAGVRMGCEEKADFLALSFIRTAEEIEEVRSFMQKHGGAMALITKVETRQAVERIDAIIAASDGIMVARGDLGAEMPFPRIPAIQDDIVARCRAAGKPVIVATHMLESMIGHPLPTRAEVTDVAHAAVTRADSTMLSGETANGKYPLRALEVMAQVLEETERSLPPVPPEKYTPSTRHMPYAIAAVNMAAALRAKAVLVLTRSGRSAQALSARRARRPVIACTHDEAVQRRLQLNYGVKPLLVPFGEDPEANVAAACEAAKRDGLLSVGDLVVLVTDVRVATGAIATIQSRLIS